jgi:hypothetical protein
MVVEFTATYAYEVYSIQHNVIKLVSALRQIGGFLWVIRFPPPIIKIDIQDITEILSIVALNTIVVKIVRPYIALHTFAVAVRNCLPS